MDDCRYGFLFQGSCNTADLGACYRLKHALSEVSLEYGEVVGTRHGFQLACSPNGDAAEIYDPMLDRYISLENIVVNYGKV